MQSDVRDDVGVLREHNLPNGGFAVAGEFRGQVRHAVTQLNSSGKQPPQGGTLFRPVCRHTGRKIDALVQI